MKHVFPVIALILAVSFFPFSISQAGPPDLKEEAAIATLKAFHETAKVHYGSELLGDGGRIPFSELVGLKKQSESEIVALYLYSHGGFAQRKVPPGKLKGRATFVYLSGKGWFLDSIQAESVPGLSAGEIWPYIFRKVEN